MYKGKSVTKRVFITGTDTDVGKTKLSQLLLNSLSNKFKCQGWKPIASGCVQNSMGEWVNQDALLLQQASNTQPTYTQVNPIALRAAIAPHIAAEKEKCLLNTAVIQEHYLALTKSLDYLIIEGAGGWLVPLNQHETLADWVEHNQLPVILVVAMRLGCLNHALLTWRQLQQQGINCLAWIANVPQPMPLAAYKENLTYLQHALPMPLLTEIPFFYSREQEEMWLAEKLPLLGKQFMQLFI